MAQEGSRFVILKNKHELAYLLSWLDGQGKVVSGFMRVVTDFPYCLTPDHQVVSWTDSTTRNWDYISFTDFVAELNGAEQSSKALRKTS